MGCSENQVHVSVAPEWPCNIAALSARNVERDAFWGMGYDFYDSAVLFLTHQCGIQNNDLSHEIGHNVGLDHNPAFAVGTQQTNLYTFSSGHEVNLHFRDDMSGTKRRTACGFWRIAFPHPNGLSPPAPPSPRGR